LKEFMDVMKGVDPTLPDAKPEGVKNKEGVKNNEEGKSRKGKEKSVEPVEEIDDDAAWLARRTGAVASEPVPENVSSTFGQC
jgi:multiple RNA-binding domain-containing protein 1